MLEKRTSSEFVSLVGRPSQYDWAFFFMYVVEPSTDLEPNDKGNILTADITVRLVDDGYFYVYTTNDEMALQVRDWYPQARYSLVEFQSLIIPYKNYSKRSPESPASSAAVIGGGSLANGATTAAFGFLFNDLAHDWARSGALGGIFTCLA